MPLKQAIQTARVRALMVLLYWISTITVFMVLEVCAMSFGTGWLSDWLDDWGMEVLSSVITLVGSWLIFFNAAIEMTAIARPGLTHLPDWHTTPLSSLSAPLAISASALVATVPAIIGLSLFTYVLQLSYPSGSFYITPELTSRDLVLAVVRLPAFCTLCGCLCLLAPSRLILNIVPWGISVSAALATLWRFDPTLHRYVSYGSTIPLYGSDLQAIIFAGLILVVMGALILFACRKAAHPAFAVLAILLCCAGPASRGLGTIAAIVDDAVYMHVSCAQPGLSPAHGWFGDSAESKRQLLYISGLGSVGKPLYYALSTAQPGMLPGAWSGFGWGDLHGDDEGAAHGSAFRLTVILTAVLLPLWYGLCVACLSFARRARPFG